MLITLLAVGNVFADEVTYVFSEQGYDNSEIITAAVFNDVISFTAAKNSGSTDPAYYNSGTAFRLYGKNSFTLTAADGYAITGVSFTAKSSNAPDLTYILGGSENALPLTAEDAVYTIANFTPTQSVSVTNPASSGHAKILSITVTYEVAEAPSVEEPIISPEAGTYYTEQTISLTCETAGADIYYSINGSDPVLYGDPFTINATATVTAYAVLGEETSSTVSAHYVFPVILNNIAAYYAAQNAELFQITGDLTFVYRSGRYIYVKDATGGLLIYDNANAIITTQYNEGDVISGGLEGTRNIYHGLDELVPTKNTAEGVAGSAVIPVEVTVAELLANSADYISQLVIVKDGIFNGGVLNNTSNPKKFTQNGSDLVIFNRFGHLTAANVPEGLNASVIGFVSSYEGTVQLFPRSAADIIPLNITMPYSCNFEGFTAEAWNIVNGDNTNKWYIGTAQGFDNNKLYISSSNGVTNKYNVSAASVSHAYAPITLPEGDVLLTFDVRTVGDANDYLQVSVMDEVPEAGTLPEEYLTRIYGVNEFTTQTVVIPASYAGEKYLVFTWNNNNAGGNQQPAAIDNIVLKNTCEMVTDIEAEVNEHTAVLTWTAPEGQNAWTVEYKIANSDVWESVNVTEATLTLNDLTTDIAYDVRIRSNCGDAASDWATAQFFVPCINITMGDVELTIGEGTSSSNVTPMNAYYKNSWTQMVYPASNFETPGYINAVSWYVNSSTAHSFNTLKIYVGTKASAINESNSDWLPMEDLTLVYEAENGTLGTASGWETYTFNTPYYYNAEDNLVIVTARTADNWNGVQYRYTSASNSVLYRRSDSSPESYGSHPGTNTGVLAANLPNMFIDYTGFICGDVPCKAPKDLAVDNHIANTIVTWIAAPGVETYEVQFAEAGSNNWTSAVVNEATSFIINGLVEGVAYDVRVRSLCEEETSSTWIETSFTRPVYCNPVTGITAENVTSNAATITWDAGEGTSWTVEFGENGFTLGEGTQVTTSSTMVMIMGFDPETTYQVYVKANCGGYMAAWSDAYTFTTDCAPYTVTVANPWFEDFEGYTGSGEKPFKCWATPVKASNGGPFVYCGYSSSCHSGANSAELKGYDNVLVLPTFTNDIHTLSLSFWATAVTPTDGTLEVGVLTDINDMDSFEFVAYATEPSSRDGVGNYMGPFSFADVTADGGRIALRYHSDYGTSNSWNLDDFTVYIPQSCPAPMNLVADVDVLEQEAEITWTPNGEENEWEVQYGTEGFVLGTGTTETVIDEASFSMTDLPDGTSYDVYVRAICSETESSDWAGPVTFEIPAACTQYCTFTLNLADSYYGADGWNGGTLTISQNGVVLGTYTIENGSASATFDLELCNDVVAEFLYTAGSYAYENSWQLLDSEGEVVLSGAGTGSSGESFTQTVTPSCGAPSGCVNSCEYTFVLTDSFEDGWQGYDDSWDLVVDGSLDIIQNGEVVTTLTLEDGAIATYQVSLCDVTETTLDLTLSGFYEDMGVTVLDPAGNVVWEFDGQSYEDGSENVIFNFTTNCDATPACSLPTDLVVTEVTENSASLAWTGDEELTYEVSYKTGVDADWTAITVTGTEATLTDLTANITYFARVKAVCDLNDTYTEVVNFYTTATVASCDDYTVSEQSGNGYFTPVNDYYKNSHTEQIYTPEEVGAAGSITKLSFNYQGSSTMTKKTNVKIYLGHTDKDEFANTSDWITDGLTLVYTGHLNCSTGWNEFELDDAFNYNGTDNLVVRVVDESGQYGSSSNKFYYTNCSGNKCLTWQNDSYTWQNASTKTGTLRTYRPDIRFNVCSSADDIALAAIHNIPNACDLSGIPVTVDIKNLGSNSVSTIQAYYSVNGGATVHETISLDEPLVQSEMMTYTFNTLANLPEASNTITVWVEILNDGNFSNNILTTNPINLIEPAEVPFVETFNAGEINDGWFVRDINGDGITFEIANGVATYTYNDEMNADDWLMTSCMYMPAGFWEPGVYEVSYSYKALDATMVENFGVYYGKKVGDEYVMNNTVATHEFSNTGFVTVRNYIIVNQGGVYYFGIHAESQAGNAGFQINDFSVKPALHFTANAADHGTVIPDGTVVYAEGDPYTLTIVPDPGYHVLAIYKNMNQVRGENTDNAGVEYYTFTPSNNDNIYVTFTTNKYVVNATVENLYETDYNNNAPGATYTPNHETVAHGGSHTGTIVVADNYNINAVTVNGMDVRSSLVSVGNNEYELTVDPIYENKNINVVVGLDSASITYFVEGYGIINNTFVVDADTEFPIYHIELPGNSNLLSTFVPAVGYHVDTIVIDGVEHSGITAYSFEHLFGNHIVLVRFVPNHYTITTAAYGNGTVSEGEEFDYDPENTYIFEATPDAGYRIGTILRNSVALDVENPAETYTETLTNILSDYTYEVMFVPNTYSITASCGEHGTISPNGVSNYYYHQNAEVVITADLGYYISSVTYDGYTYELPQNDFLTTLTIPFLNIESCHTISATFAQFTYNITVNAGAHGEITPGTDSYNFGETPTFTIAPDAGYVISDVTVDGESVGAVSTYTFLPLNSDHTIAATFAAQAFTITATAGVGGTITPSGVTNVAYNANQIYTISASAGYHVNDVMVDGASVGAVTSYTFSNIKANHTIFVTFATNDYTITVTQPDHGAITPGTTTVNHGADQAFVIAPNVGYKVSEIKVNNASVTLSSVPNVNGIYTYTFENVTANKTLTATMEAKTYTISASAGANGSITPDGNTTVTYGGSQIYSITPDDGYVIDNVVVDNINMGALTGYTFTNVIANHTISVTFKPVECEAPSFLYTSQISCNSAELHWSHPSAGITFDIRYKIYPDGALTSVSNVSGNSYELTDLTANTTYLWQVRANCSSTNHSEWSNMVSFTTDDVTIIGIEDFVKNSIKVYAEHQNVHILNNEGVNIDNVRIFDTYGKLIYSGAVNSAHEVIGLNVAAGTYIVNVATDQGFANYKVVLMK